uniref:Uncharacterized protein n=1 Tax=viral metagenome TaxID=1070528 RepID=A0A6M3XWC2_9ZZZZ
MSKLKVKNLEAILNDDNDKIECKGLIFRARINNFVCYKNKIVKSREMRLLKKESCQGCEHCGYIWEDLHEGILNDSRFIALDNIEEGKKYRIKCCIDSTDFYSGYADDWHYIFEEI